MRRRELMLSEVISLSVSGPPDDARLAISEAEKIAHRTGVDSEVNIEPIFVPAYLEGGSLSKQLSVASLRPVEILLYGYEFSRQDAFFAQALDYALRFGEYERNAILPRSLLWNDHAIAARAGVLLRLWSIYRNRDDFDSAVASSLLTQIARVAEFLARNDHFNYKTNHGVMQNLALLQLSAGVPSLSQVSRHRELALGRLTRQLNYYVSPDGFILEHSPGYHEFGLGLLRKLIRLEELNGNFMKEWRQKLRAGELVLEALRRPDGSLPIIGDTERTDPGAPMDRAGAPASYRTMLLPVSGLFIDWSASRPSAADQPMSQTVVTWSTFPSQAHKHADDLSVVLWRSGIDWISTVGYWPYGYWGRSEAEGWQGGNAPHLENEPTERGRKNFVNANAWSDDLAITDVTRHNDDGSSVRRQVVRVGGDLWLVLDFGPDDKQARTFTRTWSAGLGIRIESGPSGWAWHSPDRMNQMLVSFVGSPTPQVSRLTGNRDPFGGWIVQDHRPKASDSLRVDQTGGHATWLASVFSFSEHSAPVEPDMTVTAPDEWQFRLRSGSGTIIEVVRTSGALHAVYPNRGSVALTLAPLPSTESAVGVIHQEFSQAGVIWPKYRDLIPYRKTATLVVLIMLAIQSVVLVIAPTANSRIVWRLRWGTVICWSIVIAWMHLVYFRI